MSSEETLPVFQMTIFFSMYSQRLGKGDREREREGERGRGRGLVFLGVRTLIPFMWVSLPPNIITLGVKIFNISTQTFSPYTREMIWHIIMPNLLNGYIPFFYQG